MRTATRMPEPELPPLAASPPAVAPAVASCASPPVPEPLTVGVAAPAPVPVPASVPAATADCWAGGWREVRAPARLWWWWCCWWWWEQECEAEGGSAAASQGAGGTAVGEGRGTVDGVREDARSAMRMAGTREEAGRQPAAQGSSRSAWAERMERSRLLIWRPGLLATKLAGEEGGVDEEGEKASEGRGRMQECTTDTGIFSLGNTVLCRAARPLHACSATQFAQLLPTSSRRDVHQPPQCPTTNHVYQCVALAPHPGSCAVPFVPRFSPSLPAAHERVARWNSGRCGSRGRDSERRTCTLKRKQGG